jgi:APA family basic amino acid/polyamine antiporter
MRGIANVHWRTGAARTRGGWRGLRVNSGLISVYGNLSANMLGVPRITFALAENGDFLAIFSAIHPRFRTPYVSILAFALLSWLLALLGSFTWNATAFRRGKTPLYYGLVCASLPVLRRKRPGAAMFRLRGGTYFAVLGAGICMLLITGVNLSGSLILLATAVVAMLNWLRVRKRRPGEILVT